MGDIVTSKQSYIWKSTKLCWSIHTHMICQNNKIPWETVLHQSETAFGSTTTKKNLGDILFWATEAAGWRPASVNLGWAASRATVTDNCLTVAVTVSKPPRLILR
jgi:hypothetical protein